jgi:hypothetical protein
MVIVTRISDPSVTNFSQSAVLKTYFMVQDAIMLDTGTVPGYVFIVDAKGASLGHFTGLQISCLKLYADYLQVFMCNMIFNQCYRDAFMHY